MKKEKSGSGASGRKQYIYFNQLSFLQTSIKETTSSISENPVESEGNGTEREIILDDTEISERPVPLPSRKRKNISSAAKTDEDKLFVAVANKIMKEKPETYVERDEDTLFMLSLVGELKKIPDNWKLDVKSEILGVFQKFRKAQQFPLPPPEHHLQNHQHFMQPLPFTSTTVYPIRHHPTHTSTTITPLQAPSSFFPFSSTTVHPTQHHSTRTSTTIAPLQSPSSFFPFTSTTVHPTQHHSTHTSTTSTPLQSPSSCQTFSSASSPPSPQSQYSFIDF